MKKAARPGKQMVSKQTYQIAKSSSVESPSKSNMESSLSQSRGSHPQEDNLMGESTRGSKADAMDKNLNQMFDVLRLRLSSLDDVVKTRIVLSSHDALENSKLRSDPSSKIVDEFDEVIPRSLRDMRPPAANNKDNLVSSDVIHVDSGHLVVSRLKPATEAAKKLEVSIEESLGNFNMREMKNKKSKSLNQTEKSKKSEQMKNEAKRINRLKLEKQLQAVMDEDKTVVTRSVMDLDQVPEAPSSPHQQMEFPINVKWHSRDPRSQDEANAEGQFDPDLLLRYAIERMNIPSGKKLFSWLVRQTMLQNYFVHLFWLTKVKFFENNVREEVESYLLRQLSVEYKNLMEVLAERAHAEHEKDFAFKYIPFILTNGVYFAFFYLHPGSRHLYTRGFKKTIYMQIIQVMYGIQLCPSSVKVSWAKVFPDDIHEDGGDPSAEGMEDVGESFPIPMALKGPKSQRTQTLVIESEDEAEAPNNALNGIEATPVTVTNVATGRRHAGMVADDEFIGGATSFSPPPSAPAGGSPLRPSPLKTTSKHAQSTPHLTAAVSFSFPHGISAEDSVSSGSTVSAIPLGSTGKSRSMLSAAASTGGAYTDQQHTLPNAAHAATAGFTRPALSKGNLKGGFASDHRMAGINSPYASTFPKATAATAQSQYDANGGLTPGALAALVGIAGVGRQHASSSQQQHRGLGSRSRGSHSTSRHHMMKSTKSMKSLRGGAAGAAPGTPALSPIAFRGPPSRAVTPLSQPPQSPAPGSAGSGVGVPAGSVHSDHSSGHNHSRASDSLDKTALEQFAEDPKVNHSLSRTYLKPPIDRPSDPKLISKRQNHQDRLVAMLKSPQMELHLAHLTGSAAAEDDRHAQTFRRTIPIAWCPAGGTDTHKKTVINTDLHNEIGSKLKKSMQDQYQQAIDLHKEKIKVVRQNERQLNKVMGSGQTMISRFSLDLIRRQRAVRGGILSAKEAAAAQQPLVQAEIDMAEIQRLADYDDDELEAWLAEF